MNPSSAIVITPVKNSLEKTELTIDSVKNSNLEVDYYIYDDYSDPNISKILKHSSTEKKFNYIHLSELTKTPSPNYLTILKNAQEKSLKKNLPLIIIESDVIVNQTTLRDMMGFLKTDDKIGMIGAITVDKDHNINYPYRKFKNMERIPHKTKRSLSFCCTLLSVNFLKSYSFDQLDRSKDWFDTSISNASLNMGFSNYIMMNLEVIHQPHSSRPWKQEKYKNPFKYYWNKFTKGRDKI